MRTPKLLLFGGGGRKEYGISWNQATDVITRTNNAVGLARANFDKLYPWAYMKRCNLSDAGIVNAYKGDAGFAYDGTNGQVMVEIPKFYYKFTHSATVHTPVISREKLVGYTLHPAFVTDGRILNKIYIGAFEATAYDVSASAYKTDDSAGVDFTVGTGDKLASIAGVKPLSGLNNSLSIINARKLAQNRGTGWNLLNFNQVSALQMLYGVEYANWNTQSQISAGVTQITDDGATNMAVNTGFTAGVGAGSSDLGNASGQVSNTHYATGQTCYPMSYRGIENLYGNAWKWVDGINIKADRNPWIADHDFASDTFTHPYSNTGLTLFNANGYASNIAYGAGLDYGFLASAASGSSSTYLADYYYQTTGNRVALLGGSWLSGAYAGAFYWGLNYAASITYRNIGARAVFFN